MPDATRRQQPTLLDAVRQVLRLHHYSIHTERSSVEWIVRFVRFHRMRSRQDLFPATPKIESFLTDLALHGHVAATTQNQACFNRPLADVPPPLFRQARGGGLPSDSRLLW